MLYANVNCNNKQLKHEVAHQFWDGKNQTETRVLFIRTGGTGKIVHL